MRDHRPTHKSTMICSWFSCQEYVEVCHFNQQDFVEKLVRLRWKLRTTYDWTVGLCHRHPGYPVHGWPTGI